MPASPPAPKGEWSSPDGTVGIPLCGCERSHSQGSQYNLTLRLQSYAVRQDVNRSRASAKHRPTREASPKCKRQRMLTRLRLDSAAGQRRSESRVLRRANSRALFEKGLLRWLVQVSVFRSSCTESFIRPARLQVLFCTSQNYRG